MSIIFKLLYKSSTKIGLSSGVMNPYCQW